MEKKKNLLSVREAAQALGVSEAAIRLWIARRKITFTRIGSRMIRVPVEVVEKLIADGMVPARERR